MMATGSMDNPITAERVRLSDEAIRVTVVNRLRCIACKLYTCTCGKMVDTRELHGLEKVLPGNNVTAIRIATYKAQSSELRCQQPENQLA